MEGGSGRNRNLGCRIINIVEKLERLRSENGEIVEDVANGIRSDWTKRQECCTMKRKKASFIEML